MKQTYSKCKVCGEQRRLSKDKICRRCSGLLKHGRKILIAAQAYLARESCYEQVWDGEWQELSSRMHLQCCDCGLVHEVKIRKRKGRLEVQINRDNRRTAQIRRSR